MIVGHGTVQVLLSRAGMCRKNAVFHIMEMTRGERAHIGGLNTAEKLELRGLSVTSRTSGPRYGPEPYCPGWAV